MGAQIGGLIGLFGGLIFGLLGWYIGRKRVKNERGLDEVHDHIWLRARSYSWYATIIAIYIFFTLYILGVDMSMAMVLALLILVQLGSWGISGTILSAKMYSDTEPDNNFSYTGVGLIIILIGFILFVITIMTENWVYMLLLFLFGAVGTYVVVKGFKKNKGGN